MKHLTRFKALLFLLLYTATAWAVPFTTTSLVDGQFPSDARWYTIRIGAAGYYISGNSDAGYISLSATTTDSTDVDMWCFVGDDTNGYRIYNKKAGAGKVLASPVTMSGTTGGTAYVVLKDTADLGTTYVADWIFTSSTDLTDGWYMYQKGTTANKVNNRDNKLAFWTGGADAGSTLVIDLIEADFEVNLSTGAYTAGNSNKTWFSNWKSNATDITLNLNSGYNNMTSKGDSIVAYVGMYSPQSYTISTDADHIITGYSFDYKNYTTGQSITVTQGDNSYTSADTTQTISVTGLSDQSATFTLSGNNKGIMIYNFHVQVASYIETETQQNLFIADANQTTPYRIPAIAKAHNGNLIALTDYRPGGADVGSGHVNIVGKVSKDNGKTWSDEFPVLTGSGNMSSNNGGYGDAALVADSESDSVLLVCASGHIGYYSSTRDNPIRITRKRSADGGVTWADSTDITEHIYSLFDNAANGTVTRIFFSSGRIFQSPTLKVGKFHRIYVALCAGNSTTGDCNYVIYSDDLGETWAVLGGTDVLAVPNGNEAKCEELPDGKILVSSRAGYKRYFNTFTYTDAAKGTGVWGTRGESVSGKAPSDGSGGCNGEIMILPAKRISDGEPVFVALQSVPFGSGRTNVGIYYKELSSYSDFSDATAFATNWDGKHQVSKISSAYSTMCVQANDTIAFFYEEGTFGYSYTEVLKQYALEDITDSLYSYNPTLDREAFKDSIMKDKIAGNLETLNAYLNVTSGQAVGMISADKATEYQAGVQALIDTYTATSTDSCYNVTLEAINALADDCSIKALDGWRYTLQNKQYSTYLSVGSSQFTGESSSSDAQLFTFYEQTDGTWKLCNESNSTWLGKTGAMYATIPLATEDAAGTYTLSSSTEGLSYLTCTNPSTSGGPLCPHIDASNKLVEWYANADASQWYIVPVKVTDIAEVITDLPAAKSEVLYDLTGRRVANPVKGNIYVTNQRRKVLVK